MPHVVTYLPHVHAVATRSPAATTSRTVQRPRFNRQRNGKETALRIAFQVSERRHLLIPGSYSVSRLNDLYGSPSSVSLGRSLAAQLESFGFILECSLARRGAADQLRQSNSRAIGVAGRIDQDLPMARCRPSHKNLRRTIG